MEEKELYNQFIQLDLTEGQAKIYAKEEIEQGSPLLTSYRFVERLNKKLRFYADEYAECIKNQRISNPEIKKILELGVSPELMADYAYNLVLEAYITILVQIDEPNLNIEEGTSSWSLVEISPEGKQTGRILNNLHSLIPY